MKEYKVTKGKIEFSDLWYWFAFKPYGCDKYYRFIYNTSGIICEFQKVKAILF